MTADQATPATACEHWLQDDVPPIVEPLVAAARDVGHLKAALLGVLADLEFDQFAFARRSVRGNVLGTRWSAWGARKSGWFDCFAENGYVAIDPIREKAMRSMLPVVWDRRSFADNRRARPFFADLTAFGMSSGVTMVVHRPDAEHVDFFNVTSPEQAISDSRSRYLLDRMPDLWALGAYCCAMLPPQTLAIGNHWRCYRPSRAEMNSRRVRLRTSISRQLR